MGNERQADAKYVNKEFDEFRDLSVITHKKQLQCGGWGGGGVKNEYKFQLRQNKSKDQCALLLDCEIKAESWFYARNGRITFNCDQQNTNVEFNESRSNADHIGKTLYCFEYGHYEISPDILEAICSCSVLKIRITGGESLHEEPNAKWCTEFQSYCRQFYNNVIDPTKFQEATAKPQNVGSSGVSPLGNKIAKWLGLFLLGLVVLMVIVAVLETMSSK